MGEDHEQDPQSGFLDPLAVILIVAPIAHPAIVNMGFEGAWFAVLFVMMLEIGLVTPRSG